MLPMSWECDHCELHTERLPHPGDGAERRTQHIVLVGTWSIREDTVARALQGAKAKNAPEEDPTKCPPEEEEVPLCEVTTHRKGLED